MLIEIPYVIDLFVIGGTIVWPAVSEYLVIIMQHDSGFVLLKDILLLSIYLELGVMIGVFFKTHRLAVIFLILAISLRYGETKYNTKNKISEWLI